MIKYPSRYNQIVLTKPNTLSLSFNRVGINKWTLQIGTEIYTLNIFQLWQNVDDAYKNGYKIRVAKR